MTLDLEEKEIQLVLNALAEIPYKLSADLIANIIKQVQDHRASEPKPS